MNGIDRESLIAQFLENINAVKHRFSSGINFSSGLHFSQMAVLHLVKEHEGIGIKEMAGLLGITSSAVTQLVDGLVGKGYLLRQGSVSDRRALQLSLTDKYKEEVSDLHHRLVEKMGSMFDNLSDEELKQYVWLTKKIVNGFSDTARVDK